MIPRGDVRSSAGRPTVRRPIAGRIRAIVVGLAAGLLVGGCGLVSTTAPPATPADFPGIVIDLAARGIHTEQIVSGDAGCTDPSLIPTAIAFRARGLDQPDAVQLRIYIFRNQASYEKLRSAVDTCAAAYAAGESVQALDASPYVLVGIGDWGAAFRSAVRSALIEAAGVGG